MQLRIVVADQSEARFYDTDRSDSTPLHLASTHVDENGRLRDRDFNSDRPGRRFDHAPMNLQRRGATPHHATGGESSPHEREATLFARRLARELEREHQQHHFERLVLIAAPDFLGRMRAALPEPLRAVVAVEIGKDLVRQTERELKAQLSPELRQVR